MADPTTPTPSTRFARVGLLLATIALSLPFVRPFLTNGFPDSGDGLLNLYRVVALDYSLRFGDLWPRFLPAMHFGFGAPNFNYYSPLALYLLEGLHLAGLDFSAAFLAGLVIYGVAAALGAYYLGAAWGGPIAGLGCAVAYLYAPFYFSSFDRPAQFAALALAPWIFWAFWSLATRRRRIDFLLAALLFGALLLTHNITALYFGPLIGLYILFLAWKSADRLRTLPVLILPLVLAVGLTAFFWLPALAEQGYVQLERLDLPMFDFHNNFLPLSQTLGLPTLSDQPGQLLSIRADTLGWPQIALGLVALGLIFWPGAADDDSRRSLRGLAGLCAFAVAALLFLTTRASTPIWEHVPLVSLILFPSRLLNAASLFLSLLAGLGMALLAEKVRPTAGRAALTALCLGGMMLYPLSALNVGFVEKPPTDTIRDLHEMERSTGWLAATSAGEFVPRWVTELPHSWALTNRFYDYDLIPRLEENERVEVRAEDWGLTRGELALVADQPTTLVFEWFYFPGWRATVDGAPVDLTPTEPNGLIALDVPEGAHEVKLWFGPTPVRRAGVWISLGALIGLGALIALTRWWWDKSSPLAPLDSAGLPAIIGAAVGIGLLIFLFRLLS
jgi:hypothetical protein